MGGQHTEKAQPQDRAQPFEDPSLPSKKIDQGGRVSLWVNATIRGSDGRTRKSSANAGPRTALALPAQLPDLIL